MTTIDVTAKGAKSGKDRRVTLYAATDDDALVVIGSWGGRPRHPAWVHNLRANPRATVGRARSTFAVTAREVEGEERERLWQLLVDGFPSYAAYQKRTDRRFAIFRLEPLAPPDRA